MTTLPGHDPAVAEHTRQFVAAHHDELVAFRRHLHAYPELSNVERETTDFVVQRLEAAGLAPRVLPTGTGVLCDIGTGDGPVVALRADLDALAMDDEAEVPYRSKRSGIAHACGHDVHTTVVLGAGLALANLLGGPGSSATTAAGGDGSAGRPSVPTGRVRLLFEPAEESLPAGARDVIDAGGLVDVAAIYGLHCDPKIDVGCIAVRRGPLTSATDLVMLDLHGPGGHTARPQLTVDLVRVAGRLATELPDLVRDRARPLGEALFVWGALHTGGAANVIPARAHLGGTFRTPDREVWAVADALVADAVRDILEGTGATWQLQHDRGVPPVVNDATETDRLAAAARRVVGDDAVIEAPRSLGGDSFAWYVEEVPGTYARLGVHDPAWGDERRDLHSSTFDADERAIDIGIEVLVAAALDALRAHRP